MAKKKKRINRPPTEQSVYLSIAEDLGINPTSAKQIITKYQEKLVDTVLDGQPFEIPGVGIIEGEKVKGRTYRNPKTGGNIWKPASLTVVYDPNPELIDRLNQTWPDVPGSDQPPEGIEFENWPPPLTEELPN